MQFHELALQKYDTVNYLQQKSHGVFRMEKKMPTTTCSILFAKQALEIGYKGPQLLPARVIGG